MVESHNGNKARDQHKDSENERPVAIAYCQVRGKDQDEHRDGNDEKKVLDRIFFYRAKDKIIQHKVIQYQAVENDISDDGNLHAESSYSSRSRICGSLMRNARV